MKRIINYVVLFITIIFLASCASKPNIYKGQVPDLNNMPNMATIKIELPPGMPDLSKIKNIYFKFNANICCVFFSDNKHRDTIYSILLTCGEKKPLMFAYRDFPKEEVKFWVYDTEGNYEEVCENKGKKYWEKFTLGIDLRIYKKGERPEPKHHEHKDKCSHKCDKCKRRHK